MGVVARYHAGVSASDRPIACSRGPEAPDCVIRVGACLERYCCAKGPMCSRTHRTVQATRTHATHTLTHPMPKQAPACSSWWAWRPTPRVVSAQSKQWPSTKTLKSCTTPATKTAKMKNIAETVKRTSRQRHLQCDAIFYSMMRPSRLL
jgi:hypothetical protein